MDNWHRIARVYHPLTAGSIDGTDSRPHDRAVERAIKASYVPPSVDGDPHLTVFVARLNPDTTEKTLEKTFSKYGDLKQVNLIRDVVTGFSKQYAFIEYEDERSARRARSEADQSVIEERIVFVDWECERTLDGWIPRRLGGGFGGKKESGQLRFGGRDRPFKKPIVVQQRDHQRDRETRDGDREDRYRGDDRYRDRGIGKDRDRDRHRDREASDRIDKYRDRRDRERDRQDDDRTRDRRDEDRERCRRDDDRKRERRDEDREREDSNKMIGKDRDSDSEDGEIRDREDRESDRVRERGKDERRERTGDRYKDRERYRERDRYGDGERDSDRYRERRKERDREREVRKDGKRRFKERESDEEKGHEGREESQEPSSKWD